MKYHVWINLLSAENINKLVATLAREKFVVSLNDYDVPEKSGNLASILLYLSLQSSTLENTENVRDKIISIVSNLEIKHFGIIVSETTASCSWIGTNIDMVTKSEEKTKERSVLRLVPKEPIRSEEIPDEPA